MKIAVFVTPPLTHLFIFFGRAAKHLTFEINLLND